MQGRKSEHKAIFREISPRKELRGDKRLRKGIFGC